MLCRTTRDTYHAAVADRASGSFVQAQNELRSNCHIDVLYLLVMARGSKDAESLPIYELQPPSWLPKAHSGADLGACLFFSSGVWRVVDVVLADLWS